MSDPVLTVSKDEAGPARESRGWFALLGLSSLRESMLLLILAAIWLFFYVATDGIFLTPRNLVLLALQTSIVSLAAISAVMLIVTRNFDLSVGSAVALVGVVVALLAGQYDVNPLIAVAAGILVGLLMGAWQGFWVTRIGVSSFIVTLAGMLYFRGFSMIVTNGATIASLPRPLTRFATAFLPPVPSILLVVLTAAGFLALRGLEIRRAYRLGVIARPQSIFIKTAIPVVIAAGVALFIVSWQGIPYLVLLVAVCALAAELVMRRTRYGAQLYAIGGNPEAARLAGINIKQAIFWNFVIAGFAYGVTGVALTARVGGAVAGSAGLFLELDAIAAAIIGGTALSGGRGRILGALVGALLMGSLNNGMSLMNVAPFFQDTARGIVLLLAVALDHLSRSRSRTT
ncbi:sugar ABC transporter permease [Nordella sp. HKS 07]|uniref:sugar ABC transporter permease n=1 Tax=Nordella sp. HKS 07 TaxID=2712222 RepID=UPI0013E19D6B|nr:sugar ABC transporter permease [Nordella sp. HKS 07]QIG48451.1 sugar ABC transporter permease [Nordella sp. HKS 07]